MKKKLLLSLVLFSINSLSLSAQVYNYGNEWIDFSQYYFKVKITSEGIYRINRQQLSSAGVPSTLLNDDHRKIQIFHNGVEQYIYVYDSLSNNVLDGNDFIEFYADKNDGSLDAQLYSDTSWQPNKRYSLFNDTAIYFLTWNDYPIELPGKRVTEICCDTSGFNSFPDASYFNREVFYQNTQNYNEGETDFFGSFDVDYVDAEGWMDSRIEYYPPSPNPAAYTSIKNIASQNIFSGPGAPLAEFNTVVCGRNSNQKHLRISIDNSNTLLVDDNTFYGFQMHRYFLPGIPLNQLGTSTTDFRFRLDSVTGNNQIASASFSNLLLRYPHSFNFQNENVSSYKMFLPDYPGQPKSDLEISNFNFNGSHIFYDLTNHVRITGIQSGNQLSIYVPNSGGEKICYLTSAGQTMTAPITPVSTFFSGTAPGKFTPFQSATIASDSTYVIITHASLWSEALSYQSYRSSMMGGGRNVIVVDIDELYDQFAYGIRKHPLSIKNFARYMMDVWTAAPLNKIAPSYLFLIGKGYSPVDTRHNATLYNSILIPTIGAPGTDILFTSGSAFDSSLYNPVIPVGRLSAKTQAHVSDYLSKVQDYELAQTNTLQIPSWMKEVLHFGGGDSQTQQNNIRAYLNNYTSIVEACKYGGHVTSYYKTSTDPIQINQSDSLRRRINDGVSLMTFFGHAAATGFDISTDHPSTYQNAGKYPLVIANSCYAGNIFTASSVSEDFILQQDKGAIGFIASVHLGVEGFLDKYTTGLYKAFSDSLYGDSFGHCMQAAIKNTQIPNSDGEKRVCLEMILHGDPALRMNGWNKAELEIKQPDIYFTPPDVTTLNDSFKVNVIVHNWAQGVCTSDSFFVNIHMVYPDGSDTVFAVKQFGCASRDTITVNIPMDISRSPGLNRFEVLVDSLVINDVAEFVEVSNNFASTALLIKSSDIYPVYPYKYAIVPYNSVTLKASTADPFAPQKTYIFEIDTTDLFNSPLNTAFHKLAVITSKGGVVSWPDNLPLLQDSMVYFWRVGLDSVLTNPNYKWNESSFIYIPAKTGWSQDHFFQFRKDKYENIVYNDTSRTFDYVIDVKSVYCQTEGAPYSILEMQACYYSFNSSVKDYGSCNAYNMALQVAVIDPLTLEPWNTDSTINYFGQINWYIPSTGISTCGRGIPDKFFCFPINDSSRISSMVDMLRNDVPVGHYVLVYTTGLSYIPPFYNSLDTSFFNVFQELGWSTINTELLDSMPFIFFTRKGDITRTRDTVGTSYFNTISLQDTMIANWDKGNITSEIIGPALKWTSLHWNQNPFEVLPGNDSIHLKVFGIDNNGIETLLLQKITTAAYDTTLSFISSSTYPYLKLVAVTEDTVLRTPAQLDRWQIYYDEAPEAAINPGRFFEFHANPLAEGDSLMMRVAVENISQVPMDSMAMDFYLYDQNRNRVNLKSYKMDSLRVGQYVIADLLYPSTFGLAGNNNLWVEANPYNSWNQTEQYHFNNFAQLGLLVNKDVTNPILDVTFDGVHIIDGDIVSGKPHILVRLHDENKFLALNDTNSFTFFLKTPSLAPAPLYFFDPVTATDVLRFSPAVLPKNSCRIEWDPTFSEDGKYELIVQGRDRSLNYSGIFQYRITFEIINRSTITNVMNYPNPFSTSTRFVFTLTGSKIPDDFKIQIMTVTGKVVREIMRDELGNIHIGRNITDYAWNGKDEYGDKLANGLYLYRVITKINGENIEKRETEADNFFKNGFGKMYLMR